MAERPRALLVTPLVPARGGNGLAMRAGVLLEGLARRFDVDLLVVPVVDGPPGDDLVAAHADSVATLEPEAGADPRSAIAELLATAAGRERAALSPRPALSAGLTSAVAREVARRAEGAALVWVLRLYLAPVLDALLDARVRPPLALDLDDLDAPLARALGDEEEAAAFDRLAAHYRPRVDLVTVAAPEDARDGAVCVPNAVRPPSGGVKPARGGAAPPADVAAEPPAAAPPIDVDLLFVGNLAYRPNLDAARWLCGEIAPRLPDARIALVGSRPPAEIRALAAARVLVAGDVEDPGEWYRRAALAVAPLRTGAGTRIKVLEALAHRRAVVATSAGARGLAELPGVVVADDPDAFAAACARLLDDPLERERLAREGEEAVLAGHTAAAVAGRVDELARNMLTA